MLSCISIGMYAMQVMERYLHECVEAPGSQVWVPEEALICCSTSHPTLVRSYGYAARMLQGVPATNGVRPCWHCMACSSTYVVACLKQPHILETAMHACYSQATRLQHGKAAPA